MFGLLALFAIALLLVVASLVAATVRAVRRPPRRAFAWAVAHQRPSDPREAGLEAESWTVDRPDGASLPVWSIDTPSSDERDEPLGPRLTIVLLHEWGSGRVALLGELAPWSRLADTVVLVDRRGHGDAVGGVRLGPAEEADLEALLDGLTAERVVLVGRGDAASIALRVARRRGADPRIAAVIGIGAMADFPGILARALAARGLPVGLIARPVRAALRVLGQRPAMLDEANFGRGVPGLFLHGEDDECTPVETIERVLLEAERVRLHRVPGAAAGEERSVDPVGFDDCVTGFLRTVLGEPDLPA